MKTADIEFDFPVIGISSDNDVWGFPDLRSLTTCGPRTLRDTMQADMEIMDARGDRWRVLSVRQLGPARPLWSRWFWSLLAGPTFRIEQEVEAMERLSLAQMRDRVCSAIKAHPEFWCEEDERDTVLIERIRDVQTAPTVGDIYERLGLDTFESY